MKLLVGMSLCHMHHSDHCKHILQLAERWLINWQPHTFLSIAYGLNFPARVVHNLLINVGTCFTRRRENYE